MKYALMAVSDMIVLHSPQNALECANSGRVLSGDWGGFREILVKKPTLALMENCESEGFIL
jgi:hypothetical protein